MTDAVRHGSLVFASVGNDGKQDEPVNPPASLPGAVGVTAIDKSRNVADFSNHGDHVALAAPGVSIPANCWTSMGHKGYCVGWGTSQATALASASAALIWSAHPTWTNNQVLRVLINTAGKPSGKIPSEYLGYGIIRPRLVLLGKGVDPGPADVNPLYPSLSGKPASAPAPSTGATSAPGVRSQSAPASAAEGAGTKSSSVLPWVGVGAGVVVVAAIVVFVALRSRGRRRAQAAAATQGAPVPPQGYAHNPYATNPYATQQLNGAQPPQQPYSTPPQPYPQQPYGAPPQGYGQPPAGGDRQPEGQQPPYGPPPQG